MALPTSLSPFTFLISSSLLSHILVIMSASDKELLLKFKESIENNNALSLWNESISPCSGATSKWPYIQCYKGYVWGLTLENMRLRGVVDVKTLEEIPYLRTLSLMNNDFDTTWPNINNMLGLKTLYLSNNKFSGEIPNQAFQGMNWLKKIHLSNNQFIGYIPISLTSMPRLMELRLEGNKFTGPIPNFQHTLKSFSVANNQLKGKIPNRLRNMPISAFSGNKELCGAPLEECFSKKRSPISIIVLVVLVIFALIVIGASILFIFRRRRKKVLTMTTQNPSSNSQKKARSREASSEEGTDMSHASSHNNKRDNMKLSFVKNDREQFDLHELLRASAEILGSGCHSSSYKAALSNGSMLVVKRFKQMNNVGKEDFQEHMRRIGRLSHPNLLPLIAYYYRKEEKLLVTDFVHNGNLAIHLHGYQALGQPSLDWASRLKIVKGITKGLEYIYMEMPSLVAPHGHLKSSNVLLNESLEPILTDYGLVPMINQDLAPNIMMIYKSPEYLQNNRITRKTDVWCLGILILEILTGNLPANFLQGKGSELSLANWVRSIVYDDLSGGVFDENMKATKNNEGEMLKLLKIALACCEGDVDKRCDFKEAVERIHEVKERDNEKDNSHSSSNASEVVDRIHEVKERDNENDNSFSSSNASEIDIQKTQSGEFSLFIDG